MTVRITVSEECHNLLLVYKCKYIEQGGSLHRTNNVREYTSHLVVFAHYGAGTGMLGFQFQEMESYQNLCIRQYLTESKLTEQLPHLLDCVNNLQGFVCLLGDMSIHFDNPLQSLTKQTLTTFILHNLVQVINKPTHRCGHIIDWVIV